MLLLRETIIDGADHSKNDAKEGPEECAPCLRSKTHNDHHIAMLMKMLMMVNAHGDVMLRIVSRKVMMTSTGHVHMYACACILI